MRWSCTAVAGLATTAGGACHVVVESETTRPRATERVVHRDAAIAGRQALDWTPAGQLRFIEPLECPTEDVARQRTTIEVATRPNLATFTVGMVATAVGSLALINGLFATRPGASPYSYLGVAGLGVGLPLAIGPWIGDRTELRERAEEAAGEPRALRRPGPVQLCGARAITGAARSATLEVEGLEIRGAIDRDGVFSISPYQWIDAYGTAQVTPATVTAIVDGDSGARTITAVLDAGALANHAAGFLAHAELDAEARPLTLVPGIVAGTLRASMNPPRQVLRSAWCCRFATRVPATPGACAARSRRPRSRRSTAG